MGLSIKDDEVEAMIREVVAARNVSMTEAVRRALLPEVERLRAERAVRVAEREAIMMEALERLWALPLFDAHSPDEILGDDAIGLPT